MLKPDTWWLILLALLLLLGMLVTLEFGGAASRHGYGHRGAPASSNCTG